MVRPFFAQQYAPPKGSRVGEVLLSACRWWDIVLQHDICEEVRLDGRSNAPVVLLTDARGLPAHTGAVLSADGLLRYTSLAPPESVTSWFASRSDSQIMGLEILAVIVALSTFWPFIVGRTVLLFVDNTGGELAILRGSAKSADHNSLVHGIWSAALIGKVGLWVERVATDDNLSDLPSREDFGLLQQIGAVWCKPRISEHIWSPAAPASN